MSAAAGAAARRNGWGWYLYGIVAADQAQAAVVPGAGEAPDVVLVSEGPLAGVASRVSLEEFDEASLPERFRDASWLEQKIRTHESVLEQVLAGAAVIPCRFCTVYRSEEELRRFLSERQETLRETLRAVEGRVELGVKAFVDRDRFNAGRAMQNEAIKELAERVAAGQGGRAYLEGRRLEQLQGEELDRFRAEAGGQIHARLLPEAEDGRPLALQRPEVAGREEEMLFNGAYLVSNRARFEEALREVAVDYRTVGVEFELTGPWPPYNFVPTELSAS